MKLETVNPESGEIKPTHNGGYSLDACADGLIRLHVKVYRRGTSGVNVGGVAMSPMDAKNLLRQLPQVIEIADQAERRLLRSLNERIGRAAKGGER